MKRPLNEVEVDGLTVCTIELVETTKRISRNIKINEGRNRYYSMRTPGTEANLVFAENDEEMANKIVNITNSFQSFDVIDLESVKEE
jgi:hypothetical protein